MFDILYHPRETATSAKLNNLPEFTNLLRIKKVAHTKNKRYFVTHDNQKIFKRVCQNTK